MKTQVFATIAFVGASTLVEAAMIGTAVKGAVKLGTGIASAVHHKKGKRDLEFEDALLVVRDRTIQQWAGAVCEPSSISAPMLNALGQQGYTPPAGTKARRASPAEMASQPHNGPISKALALDAVQHGKALPPKVLKSMQKCGWSGPPLQRRDFGFEEELYARDFDDYFGGELYARDAEPEAEAEAEADPELFYDYYY